MIALPPIKTQRLVIWRHILEDFETMRFNFRDEEATRLRNMTPDLQSTAAVRLDKKNRG